MASSNSCNLQLVPRAGGLFLNARVGDRGLSHFFQVDTGSTGIVVPHAALGNSDLGPALPDTGTSYGYISSGKAYLGSWHRLPVFLDGAQGTPGVRADVAVFVVDHMQDGSPFVGGMMGIGFQESPPNLPADERMPDMLDRNPFLNAQCLPNGPLLTRSYLLTKDSITLGPRAADTQSFAMVQLQGDAASGWSAPECDLNLSYQGVSTSNRVSLLMDTGITEMLIFLENELRPSTLPAVSQLPVGATVAVNMAGTTGTALAYQFTVGHRPAMPIQPPAMFFKAQESAGLNLNTGFSVLNAYAYFFDYDQGLMGLRLYPQ